MRENKPATIAYNPITNQDEIRYQIDNLGIVEEECLKKMGGELAAIALTNGGSNNKISIWLRFADGQMWTDHIFLKEEPNELRDVVYLVLLSIKHAKDALRIVDKELVEMIDQSADI